MHRAKGDRLVRASVLPVCDNEKDSSHSYLEACSIRQGNGLCYFILQVSVMTAEEDQFCDRFLDLS